MAWEVAEIVGICKLRGYVLPTLYEGAYNVIDRLAEDELFPCLRKHGIRFAAYCPLAGGYLTSRFFVPAPDTEAPAPNFDPKKNHVADYYTGRYLTSTITNAVAGLLEVVKAHGLSLAEVALRWLQWHSQLRPDDHGVIVAADDGAQLEMNLVDW